MKLSHYTQGRDNNFNLVRILAAFAVLVSHSYALTTGAGAGYTEPLLEQIGMTLGSVAVDIFFVASGFLVCGSLLNRKSAVEFLWARVLRIYPALLVMVLLVVFGLGVYFTTLPLATYFSNVKTYAFLVKNSTLFAGILQKLPGVFAGNPFPNSVNGSLWSMPYEVRMYALLLVFWTAARLAKANRFRAFEYAVVALALATGVWKLTGFTVDQTMTSGTGQLVRLLFAFFSGAAFYVLKEHIELSRWVFLALLVALLASALDQRAFFVVYTLSLTYPLLYLAYVPAGWIRGYNRVGDYSYGVYIYAFPVQQSIAALIPGVSVLSMFLLSASITLTLAVLSWPLLERRALGLKGYWVGHTRRLLGATAPANAQSAE
jgi:peptidoglycan/LPS O-acetylase OafA/YrhL